MKKSMIFILVFLSDFAFAKDKVTLPPGSCGEFGGIEVCAQGSVDKRIIRAYCKYEKDDGSMYGTPMGGYHLYQQVIYESGQVQNTHLTNFDQSEANCLAEAGRMNRGFKKESGEGSD